MTVGSWRETWGGRFDFILSSIGFAVGLGNAWRFPYKTYENGGASFLIPYAVFLITVGLPMYFMEMSIGQFAGTGPISMWKAVPFFKGVGWAMVIISVFLAIYYNMIIAYIFYYLFSSFTQKLPWQECSEDWTLYHGCKERDTMARCDDTPSGPADSCVMPVTPAMIYWQREVLDQSRGIDDDTGALKWKLSLCLLLAWVVVYAIIFRGIRSSGKVVYLTATLPYILLFIMLGRNASLEGAKQGVEFYLKPDWDKLKDAKVWYEAANQIALSLGIGYGGIMTMASYNKFNNNIFRDALVVVFINVFTSLLAGFVIFCVIGHIAHMSGSPVEKVLTGGGPGLAFVAYAEGLAKLPIAPLWSILFFLTLVLLGIDSQFVSVEIIVTALVDEFRIQERWRHGRIVTTTLVCLVLFGAGLILTSRAGIYIVHIMDTYVPGFAVLAVLFLEAIGISWFYGVRRFSDHISLMIGDNRVYQACQYFLWWPLWAFITPVMLLFIIVFGAMNWEPITYSFADQVRKYPEWADYIGWCFVGISLAMVVLVAFRRTMSYCCCRNQALCGPTEDFGRPMSDVNNQHLLRKQKWGKKSKIAWRAYDKTGKVVSQGGNTAALAPTDYGNTNSNRSSTASCACGQRVSDNGGINTVSNHMDTYSYTNNGYMGSSYTLPSPHGGTGDILACGSSTKINIMTN